MKDLVTKINEAAGAKTMDCKLGPFVCSVAMVFAKVHTYTKEDRKGNSNISMKSLLLLNNVQFIHNSWLPPD